MSRRPLRPALPPEERYRMRRLTDEEMARLRRFARQGRRGPQRALDALWELILRDAEGVTVQEAASRPGGFKVQDYAIARDQADALLEAMTQRRRLPRRTVGGFHALWGFYSPADYDDRTPIRTRRNDTGQPAGATARRSGDTDDMTLRWDLIDEVVAGRAQMAELDDAERRIAHDRIDDAIRRAAETVHFGQQLLAEGQSIVVMTDDGRIEVRHPDGRTELAD